MKKRQTIARIWVKLISTEEDLDLDQVHLSKVRTPKGTEGIGDPMGKSEIQFSQTSVSIPSVPFGV